MIYALIAFDDPLGGAEAISLTVVPHPGYGTTPELVHETLLLALTAEWPCLLTAGKELLRFRDGLFRSLRTWESDPAAGPPL